MQQNKYLLAKIGVDAAENGRQKGLKNSTISELCEQPQQWREEKLRGTYCAEKNHREIPTKKYRHEKAQPAALPRPLPPSRMPIAPQ